jgi:hypothetical protein
VYFAEDGQFKRIVEKLHVKSHLDVHYIIGHHGLGFIPVSAKSLKKFEFSIYY